MKKLFFIQLFCLVPLKGNSQFVTIPDPQFVSYLTMYYPTAMQGNQMDTTDFSIVHQYSFGAYLINSNFIFSSLEGIQYFDSLRFLHCNQIGLEYLPRLPANLEQISCASNNLSQLPPLPKKLKILQINNNQLTELPELPDSLENLYVYDNQLTHLPNLPNKLKVLACNNNQLIDLPQLPPNLEDLNFYYNQVSEIPVLPTNLKHLACGYNPITTIPTLPNNLESLSCNQNLISELPTLPPHLNNLSCDNNLLTSLPDIPNTMNVLYCRNNFITVLPEIPAYFYSLNCSNNQLNCIPFLPNTMAYIEMHGNPFTCLPNYIDAMNDTLLQMPLCGVSNLNSCPSASLYGFLSQDQNMNCEMDLIEKRIKNVPIRIKKLNDNTISQTQSISNGFYVFNSLSGNYNFKIDTLDLPFKISCLNPVIDTTFTMNNSTQIDSLNYYFTCKPGFDLGIQSVLPQGIVFPGMKHNLKIIAGDVSQWFGLNCAAGISGTLSLTVDGPITFSDPVFGSLTPIVSGNSYQYSIPDFGLIDSYTDFGLEFWTDTTAQMGDFVSVTATIQSNDLGDNNIENNTLTFNYPVFNSYDPNNKITYPEKVLPGYDGYFTYTINFQNLGNFAAQNIRILDTLSNLLDLSTFRVTNYSHPNTIDLTGNKLNVRFPNIQLADSASNPEGSKGFIQYKIKPKANLSIGNEIRNTAHIYFDYNPAVVTNTSLNLVVNELKVLENSVTEFDFSIFPNPSNGEFTVQTSNYQLKEIQIFIYSISGNLIHENKYSTLNGIAKIDCDLNPGIYIVQAQTDVLKPAQYKRIVIL